MDMTGATPPLEERHQKEGHAQRRSSERRASTRHPSGGHGTPGRSRRVADRRMSASALETQSGSSTSSLPALPHRGLERRASRASADRALLGVQRSESDKDRSPCPSRRSSQSHSQSSLTGSPRTERSPKRRMSQHSLKKHPGSGSVGSSPSNSPKRHQSQRHSSTSSHHHHHHHKSSRSSSMKAGTPGTPGTPGSTSSSFNTITSDPPTSKTHLLKQNALAQRGISVEEAEPDSGEAPTGEGQPENLSRPAAEMAVAGLVMIAGTGALVVSFATGGTTWTIVGSTCMGLGALFLVVGICWYLSKTKDQEEEVEIRVVDAKQLAQLIKQGMIVKPVNEV